MPGVSVVTSTHYREAFRAYSLGEPLDENQRAVLEAGRREGRLPNGRYPLPSGVESTPQHTPGPETAVDRVDGPTARTAPRSARSTPRDEER